MSRTRVNSSKIEMFISPEALSPQKAAALAQPRSHSLKGASWDAVSACVGPTVILRGPWWLDKHPRLPSKVNSLSSHDT